MKKQTKERPPRRGDYVVLWDVETHALQKFDGMVIRLSIIGRWADIKWGRDKTVMRENLDALARIVPVWCWLP